MDRNGCSVAQVMEKAVGLHRQGELSHAEALYREVLRTHPDHPDALHLLGVLAHQSGRDESAVELIGRAIELEPSVPDYHNNLGNALRRLGRLGDAGRHFRRALRLAPAFAEAHNNLGLVLRDQGKHSAAAASFRAALRLQPELAEVHNNLGLALRDLGNTEAALACYREALRLKPVYPEALSNLGAALHALGRPHEGVPLLRQALCHNPRLVEAHTNLGAALRELGQRDEAARCLEQALALDPDRPEANINLAALLQEEGRLEEAVRRYERALAARPDSIHARWGRCMAQIEILHDDLESLRASRGRYAAELEALARSLDLERPGAVEAAAQAAGGALPFFLAYQGENDLDLQTAYGDMVHRVMAARFPQHARRLPPRPPAPGETLRVGFVSAFFHYHSNWKIPIRGWVENLDPQRFAFYGYHTGNRKDETTAAARRSFVRFVEGPRPLEEWCRTIAGDRLHVLVFPEIGMHSTTLRLAALRLAPVQCASWGHPETSGLPTVDYFLSSDLMEPEGAEAHYRERLVRLPNLSIHYMPDPAAPSGSTTAPFGLPPGSPNLLCAQSLFKYMPQYDDVFPRIARAAGGCRFAFLSFGGARDVDDRFMRRLERAFARFDMKASEHVTLIPKLSPLDYRALNETCDLFLDSLGWSGCNSTLEAIARGLPVIAFPGELMRGRHSAAFLGMMGLQETIARSIDEYVEIAARLARDAAERRRVRERVEERRERLYRDMESVRGLESFLENAASGKLP